MRPAPWYRAVAVFTLLALAAGCASTDLPPISSAGARFQPLADERELWKQAEAEERQLLSQAHLYPDPLLESYLETVVARLNPPRMAANPAIQYRIHVIEDPTLNAFGYPHGSIYVHTGLLARVENEDQLATVLGHEMTHVERRHMLRYERSARNKGIGLAVAAVALDVVATVAEGVAADKGHPGTAFAIDLFSGVVLSLGLELAFVAAIDGYGRGLEDEADQGSFAKVAAAGYRLDEAPKVYETLLEDHGDSRKAEAFFFGSHPRLTERIASSKQYVAAHPATAALDATPADPADPAGDDTFARRIHPVVRDDARLNLEIGRLKVAESELARVRAWMPRDPEARYLEGSLKLAQADEEKDGKARERLRGQAATVFQQAIELDPERPSPYRELGLLFYERGNFRGACRELRRYAELAPATEARGSERAHGILQEMERDGRCE
ncbi:MAG TPA: tetratricopeptide repeat protein [Thermoanaerobaculia bacterium]|jgi:predicted Zn-dependent protease|nr:tetratricopeptide repeat protein [Thermoanaerobaculia bacterium]